MIDARTAIIIDDDPVTGPALCQALSAAGWEAVAATSAVLGFRIAVERSPSLIVLSADLQNGIATCNRAKRDPGLRDVPLALVCTDLETRALALHRSVPTRAAGYFARSMPAEALAEELVLLAPAPPAATAPFELEPPPLPEESAVAESRAAVDAELDRLSAHTSLLQRTVDELERAREDQAEHVRRLTLENAGIRRAAAGLRGALEDSQRRVAELEAEWVASEQWHARRELALEQELVALRAEAEAMRDRLASVHAEVPALLARCAALVGLPGAGTPLLTPAAPSA